MLTIGRKLNPCNDCKNPIRNFYFPCTSVCAERREYDKPDKLVVESTIELKNKKAG